MRLPPRGQQVVARMSVHDIRATEASWREWFKAIVQAAMARPIALFCEIVLLPAQ